MKNKLYAGTIVFIVLSIGNIFFSFLLHNILSGIRFDITKLKFNECLHSIAANVQHLRLFLCIEAFILLFVVVICISFRNSYKSEMMQVTGRISTPKPDGQCQHGSARWMTADEKNRNFDVYMLDEDMLRELIKHGHDDTKCIDKERREEYENEETKNNSIDSDSVNAV